MSLLVSLESAEFMFIKEKTGATAGNLSIQINKLEAAGYLQVQKAFKEKKPVTTCKILKKGIIAFENYVKNLKSYISN